MHLLGAVKKESTPGRKKYPDFGVCEHFDSPLDPPPSQAVQSEIDKDVVRLIIEIATLPRSTGATALSTLRNDTIAQLVGYMRALGRRGDRWRGKVLGIALVGTHAACLEPAPGQLWVLKSVNNTVWHSIYDDTFQTWIEEAVQLNQ